MECSAALERLRATYARFRPQIERRLEQFRWLWKHGINERLFAELVFCLLTPQSKARSCWEAVELLVEKGLLLGGSAEDIAETIRGRVRFHNQKAVYVVRARRRFGRGEAVDVRGPLAGFRSGQEAREWLVESVCGMGYKEASHFLRNIGYSTELAILDRHILKNLRALGVIEHVPRSLPKRRYLEIERAMVTFCQQTGFPLSHLDLVLWAAETGEVFK